MLPSYKRHKLICSENEFTGFYVIWTLIFSGFEI